jgi:hypothetical protein
MALTQGIMKNVAFLHGLTKLVAILSLDKIRINNSRKQKMTFLPAGQYLAKLLP